MDSIKKAADTIEHKEQNYGLRPQAKDFPMMVVLSFTYVCNALCPNCPYTNSEIRTDYEDAKMLGEDTFKLIADQCGEYGAWLRVTGGGEPMLHPRAVEMVEYAKKVGAKVGLISNGSAFTEDSIVRLLAAQTDMIEISVDAADEATYNVVRAGLNWERLLRNVTRMVSLRNEMKSPTKIIASGIDQQGVDSQAVANFWEKIVDVYQNRKFLTWGINDPHNSADSAPFLPPEERIPCPCLFERVFIDSRGTVRICGFDITGRTDMGNVHEKSIKEIWRGEQFEYYREKHLNRQGSDIEICRTCTDWQYRSWKHNYWKIINRAEAAREQRLGKQVP